MKKLILLSLTILFFSCSNKEELSKIKTLEQQKSELEAKNKELKKTFISNAYTIEKLKDEKQQNVSINEVENFITDLSLTFSNPNNIFKVLYNGFDLNKSEVGYAVITSHILEGYNQEISYWSNKENLFNNLFSKIDRSERNLEKILTPDAKDFVCSLLKRNDVYEESGADKMVESLLLVYNQLQNDPQALNKIYRLANTSYSELNDFLETITTDEIQEILVDNYHVDRSEDETSQSETRIHLVYTFWGRRYKEGNMDVVYYFLKDVHESIVYNDEVEY